MDTNRPSRTVRALSATALGLTLALTTTACGDTANDTGSTSSPVSTAEHNDQDVAFATDMLQHHAQALTMVDLTEGRTLDPEVQALADAIRAAQTPEIDAFTGWLTDWNEDVPKTTDDGGHDMGDMDDMGDSMDSDMPGMMSADDMTALENAPDADFQTMWLRMMIEHHTGALDMAKAQTADGQYNPAIDLASDIITSQTAEIDTMKTILGS